MNKQAWTIAKMNLKNIRIPYFVTGLVFITLLAQSVIYAVIAVSGGKTGIQMDISAGNYLWLLVLLAAVFIPARNFRRIINLGGKRNGFFYGSIAAYSVLAGAVSLANTVIYYTYDHMLIGTGAYVGAEAFLKDTSLFNNHNVIVNLIDLFGWSSHSMLFTFIQQFAFLLLLAAAVHTLTAIQDKWYGWITDSIIAAILALFIPIATLRTQLLWFLNLIIFNANPFIQIIACLFLTAVVYALSKPILAKKMI